MGVRRRASGGVGSGHCPFLVLAALVALVLAGQAASADGKVYSYLKDSIAAQPLSQSEQRAAILCRDGIERLVIAVNIRPEDDAEAVWIFPVLGTPDNVTVDVADAFPDLRGTDPIRNAAAHISDLAMVASASQIWTVLVCGVVMPSGAGTLGATPAVLHTEVEKWGIHAETVTADSTAALAAYLEEKGRALPAEELDAFKPYLTDGYVLVVAWISSQEELREKFPLYGRPLVDLEGLWPCLYVEFPSEKPFYPMRPTSTYGAQRMMLNLFLVGCFEPESFPGKAWYGLFSLRTSRRPERGPARFLAVASHTRG